MSSSLARFGIYSRVLMPLKKECLRYDTIPHLMVRFLFGSFPLCVFVCVCVCVCVMAFTFSRFSQVNIELTSNTKFPWDWRIKADRTHTRASLFLTINPSRRWGFFTTMGYTRTQMLRSVDQVNSLLDKILWTIPKIDKEGTQVNWPNNKETYDDKYSRDIICTKVVPMV